MSQSSKEGNQSVGAHSWLQRRIMLPVFIGLILVVSISLFIFSSLMLRAARQEQVYDSASMVSKWNSDLYHHDLKLSAVSRLLAENTDIRFALLAGDRDQLLEQGMPLFEKYKKDYIIDTMAILDHERRVLVRYHSPENFGEKAGFSALKRAEVSGHDASGIDFGSMGRLVQRSIVPVLEQGKRIGYVVVGESFDHLLKHLDFTFTIKHVALADKVFLERRAPTSIFDAERNPIDITQFASLVILNQTIAEIPARLLERIKENSLSMVGAGEVVEHNDRYYALTTIPVMASGDETLGTVVALRDITKERGELIRSIVLVSIAVILVTSGLYISLLRVTRRTESQLDNTYNELKQTRLQLDKGQEYWDDAFNAIEDPVFIHDADFRVVRANKMYAQLADMSLEQIIGRRYYRCFPKSDRPMTECVEALQSNVYDEDEHEVVLPDGSIYLTRGFVTRDTHGSYMHSVHIMTNITRDREREKLVSETASRLSSIMRAVPVGVGLLTNRIINYVNENVCDITGYKSEELVGQSSRVLYDDDAEFERVGRIKYAAIRETGTGEIETRMRRKDGRLIDVIMRSSAIDMRDLSRGVTFTIMDITEAREKAQELRQREEILHALVDNLPHVVFMKDRNLNYLFANKKYADDLGIPADAIAGKTDLDFYAEDVAEKYRKDDEAIMQRDEIRELEEEYIVDGETFTMHTIKVPLHDESGGVSGIIGISLDMTERKAQERRLLDQLDELRRFEKVSIGREERIKQLRDEIRILKNKLDREE